jgi:hypothetical protein
LIPASPVGQDTEHHLIVTHEVTNLGTDKAQLSHMAKRTKAALAVDQLEVVADRGYFSGTEILASVKAGITVTLPKPQTSNNTVKGLFVKADYRHAADEDVYISPAGERLDYRFTSQEHGQTLRRYWTNIRQCRAIKGQCATSKQRRVTSWKAATRVVFVTYLGKSNSLRA